MGRPTTINPDTGMAMLTVKLRSLALTWLLALGLSAALVAAGRRWPHSLPIQALSVWIGLFLLPAAALVVLWARWSVPDSGESSGAMQER